MPRRSADFVQDIVEEQPDDSIAAELHPAAPAVIKKHSETFTRPRLARVSLYLSPEEYSTLRKDTEAAVSSGRAHSMNDYISKLIMSAKHRG